jgi:hypothetical protein
MIEKLKNLYTGLNLKQKVNEIIEKVNGINDNVNVINDIVIINFQSSEWVKNTIKNKTVYIYQKTGIGSSKAISVFRTNGDSKEQVFPDKTILNDNGTIEMHSPVAFNGCILVSKV